MVRKAFRTDRGAGGRSALRSGRSSRSCSWCRRSQTAAGPRPAPARPASVGSQDVPLSSRHPGAVGDRLDRPLDADVRDRRHGAARDRVSDGADAHRRMAAQRPGPPRVHADVAGEGRGLRAGGDGRGDRATRPGRGRAGPGPAASSGARQRPAAVPRVSRPAQTARAGGGSASGLARQELKLELMVRRCVPAHLWPCQRAPTPGPNSTPSARCNGQKRRSVKNPAPLPGKLSQRPDGSQPH